MEPISYEPSGIFKWAMSQGQVLLFFSQVFYWLAIAISIVVITVLLFYAVWQYKRWVNYQLGVGRSGKLRPDLAHGNDGVAAGSASEAPDISVEQFVD